MVRYNYNQQVQPPAPFIYVTVSVPGQAARSVRIPALIDSGADMTVIPPRLLTDLRLIRFSEVGIGGFRSAARPLDTFLVTLQIHDWMIEAVEVISGDDSYGILGRDVLNQFLLTLDGPDLALTLQRSGSDPA